jgi:hypothetical protein
VTDSKLSPPRHERRRKAKVRLRAAFAPDDEDSELPSPLFRGPGLLARHRDFSGGAGFAGRAVPDWRIAVPITRTGAFGKSGVQGSDLRQEFL